MNRASLGLIYFTFCALSRFACAQDSLGGSPDAGAGASNVSFGSASTPYGSPQYGEGALPPSQVPPTNEGPVIAPQGVVLPAGYGFVPQTFIPGEGRFAQPPYRVTFSLSQGYDDNVYTAPDTQRLPFPGARMTTLPKVGSWETYGNMGVQIRLASPRSVFSLDANLGGTYYWRRSTENFDFNDSVTLYYAHQFSPRLQVDAEAVFVIAPQEDFSNFNAPNGGGGSSGEYFIGTSKFDLTYQWTPRFQTVSSYVFNTLVYTNSAFSSGNYYQNILGNQFRFNLNPRLVAVAEYRFASTETDFSSSSSVSNFLLGGFDYSFNRRLSATVRAGAELRDYQMGNFQDAPFVETTLQYVYGHNSTIVWDNRYGFEPAGLAQTRQTSYRTSLAINQVVTARIVANLGFNYDHFDTDNIANNINVDTEDDFNVSVGATYTLNKNFSLNAAYTFTDVVSSLAFTSYTRNRIFFGATYTF